MAPNTMFCGSFHSPRFQSEGDNYSVWKSLRIRLAMSESRSGTREGNSRIHLNAVHLWMEVSISFPFFGVILKIQLYNNNAKATKIQKRKANPGNKCKSVGAAKPNGPEHTPIDPPSDHRRPLVYCPQVPLSPVPCLPVPVGDGMAFDALASLDRRLGIGNTRRPADPIPLPAHRPQPNPNFAPYPHAL